VIGRDLSAGPIQNQFTRPEVERFNSSSGNFTRRWSPRRRHLVHGCAVVGVVALVVVRGVVHLGAIGALGTSVRGELTTARHAVVLGTGQQHRGATDLRAEEGGHTGEELSDEGEPAVDIHEGKQETMSAFRRHQAFVCKM